MATLNDVLRILFGPKIERPKTLKEFDDAIVRAENEIARANVETAEHLAHIELLESEVAFDDGGDFAKQLERERTALRESKDRSDKFVAAKTGLTRRRGQLLDQQAAVERAAWLDEVRQASEAVQSACGRIDVAHAEETAAWKDALDAAARLHRLMPAAVARRELGIALEKLRPPAERPAMQGVARDIAAVASRCTGDEERAA